MTIFKKIYNFLYLNKHFIISFLILIFIFEFFLDSDFKLLNILEDNYLYFFIFGVLFELSLFAPMLKNFYLFKFSNLNLSIYVPIRLIYFSYLGDNIAINIGGDVTKFSIYKKFFSLRKTLFFIFFDKLAVLISKFFILLILLTIFIYLNYLNYFFISFFIFIFSTLLFYIFINQVIKISIKNKFKLWKFNSTYILIFINKIKSDKNLLKIFFIFLITSLFHQIYLCILFFLICLQLEIPVSFIESSIIFLLLIILSRLPLSFSGFGIREFFSIVFFSVIGISSDLAFSASMFFGLIALFPMISSTFLYIYKRNIL